MNLPLNIDFRQILLHLLNFLILFAALYFLLYAPIKKFMKKRKEYFENQNKEIKEKKEQADLKEKEYSEKMKSVESRAEEEYRLKVEEGEKEKERIINQALQQKSEILAEAEKSANDIKNQAVYKANKEIVEMAVKTVEEKISSKEDDAFYDEFLKVANAENEDEKR